MTFKQFLTEGKSRFKRPYRIIGNFVPSNYDRETIENEFVDFLKSKGINKRFDSYYTSGFGEHVIRDPDQNAMISSHGYHKDITYRAGDKNLLWSNIKPTKIRLSKKVGPSFSSRYKGKRVGGDIKPGDVVVLNDRISFHSMPDNMTRKDNRWFIGAELLKKKKKYMDESFLLENVFKKLKQHPYRILGNLPISRWNLEHNQAQKIFSEFLKNTNYSIKKNTFELRKPERTARASKDPDANVFHQDYEEEPHRPSLTLSWANKQPTLLKTLAGKKTGEDVKPYDVVLIYNRRSKHASPKNVKISDQRYWIGADLIKKKRLKESGSELLKKKKKYIDESFLLENIFKKAKQRPYKVIGQFTPTSYDRETIKKEFTDFIHKNTPYKVQRMENFDVHPPDINAMKALDGVNRIYHQDFEEDRNKTSKWFGHRSVPTTIIMWSNKTPTKIRTVSKTSGAYTDIQRERTKKSIPIDPKINPGKRVGGDIKPNDAVVLFDKYALHSTSEKYTIGRWFARAVVKKYGKHGH